MGTERSSSMHAVLWREDDALTDPLIAGSLGGEQTG